MVRVGDLTCPWPGAVNIIGSISYFVHEAKNTGGIWGHWLVLWSFVISPFSVVSNSKFVYLCARVHMLMHVCVNICYMCTGVSKSQKGCWIP